MSFLFCLECIFIYFLLILGYAVYCLGICQLKVFSICSLLVKYAMSESVETWKGYIYAILMFLTAILNSLLLQSLFKHSYDAGGRAKAAVISMVYKKVRITSDVFECFCSDV